MSESTDSPRLPWRQIVEQATVVEVDGSTMPDPETGQPRPVITLRMPAFVAESLAAVLAAWSVIGSVAEESWSGDELATATALNAAAVVARRTEDQPN